MTIDCRSRIPPACINSVDTAYLRKCETVIDVFLAETRQRPLGILSALFHVFLDLAALVLENVFERHQKHLYQRLAFELGWRDMSVSLVYAAIQFGLIFLWEWRLKQMDSGILLSAVIYVILFVAHRLIYRYLGKLI